MLAYLSPPDDTTKVAARSRSSTDLRPIFDQIQIRHNLNDSSDQILNIPILKNPGRDPPSFESPRKLSPRKLSPARSFGPDPNPAQPPEMEAWEECAGQQAEERVRSVLTNVVEKLLEDEIKLNGWRKTKFANDRAFERIVNSLPKTSPQDAAGDSHVNPFNRFLVSTN